MKMVMRLALMIVVTIFVSGCAAENETKMEVWKEGPFTKVQPWVRANGTMTKADVWLECEAGEKISAHYADPIDKPFHRPRTVYLTRKDGTRRSVPVEVHDPDGKTLRIHTYHLMVKGREVDFFAP